MSKGQTLRSRATGLKVTVVEVMGTLLRVKDDEGRVLNRWFDEESFLKG